MTNIVLLNNIDHHQLRVLTGHGARYGDNVMFATTFPAEFRDVQTYYPIVFRKSDDGVSFEPLALFGFTQGENLFLEGEKWDADYVPLSVVRQPFLIGVGGGELLVHVDLDHPRVSRSEGEALFRDHGGTTEFLEQMNSTLLALHQGIQSNAAFAAALLEHQLLESFVLDVELDEGSQHRLSGFYTINEERLAGLDGAALASLHRAGHLHAIYMVSASLPAFRNLIQRKNHAARS